jgi:DNA repair protein RAD16
MQWKHEIETHAEGLKVLVWHGGNRNTNIKEITKYDVVLSTYAVLESCFRKQQHGFKRKGQIVKEASPLHKIQWRRTIVSLTIHRISEPDSCSGTARRSPQH